MLFCLGLHGMNPQQIRNKRQLKLAIAGAVTMKVNKNDSTCVLSYIKLPFLDSPFLFTEMAATSRTVIEELVQEKVINEECDKDKNDAYVLFCPNQPNQKLEGDKNDPVVRFWQYKIAKKQWYELTENSNPSDAFMTDWGLNNCKAIVYNIHNTNNIPMKHHLSQIRGFWKVGVPLIVSIDSEVQDDSVMKNLEKEQKISAVFGVNYKQPKEQFSGVMMFLYGCGATLFVGVFATCYMIKFLRYNK